jgi:RimJ/RimL family protein N-acetyltransferase
MTFERQIIIEGNEYLVVMSDDKETLLAAQAAGRVIVGLLREDRMDADLSPAKYVYLMNSGSCERTLPDDDYLERVVRRTAGLPWIIAESPRLLIREFTMDDLSSVMREDSDLPDDAVFYTPELLQAYIREQYSYYECGMWAVIRKSDNRLIGKAGFVPESEAAAGSISEGEAVTSYALGYHIFTPFRRQGYAKEACRLILHDLDEEFDGQAIAYVMSDNTASIRLLEQLGFQLCPESADSLSAPDAPTVDTRRCTQVQRLRYRRA